MENQSNLGNLWDEPEGSAPLHRTEAAEIQGAADLAIELAADICSDHCDLDPDEPEKMVHCVWCSQARRIYQALKTLLAKPAEASGAEQSPPVTPKSPTMGDAWNALADAMHVLDGSHSERRDEQIRGYLQRAHAIVQAALPGARPPESPAEGGAA